jgi:putative DNA methylase
MKSDIPIVVPKKLIEVALPLDAINAAAAKEKAIRYGHPSTLHLWWARRPLAAARAVIFSQLVNDPEDLWRCQNPGVEPNKQVKGNWTKARARLFAIIEDLVKWESTTNENVLEKAREEVRRSWRETCELNKEHPQSAELFDPDKMPGLHDPFAGGGAIPLEAQRLGLEAYASDLNPVAVLINKSMIQIPPKFSGRPPVHSSVHNGKSLVGHEWKGAFGLAEDVRYYGKWIRDEAFRRIGHLYPLEEITKEMVRERSDLKPYEGQKLTVIAWLWARTVKSPNPAFSHVHVPLVSSFVLATKPGKEVYVEPTIKGDGYSFTVRKGKPTAEAKAGTKLSRGASFRCLLSGTPIESDYIKREGMAGRIGERLMAIVAEGVGGRVYVSPTPESEAIARKAYANWKPDAPLPDEPLACWAKPYGLSTFGDLFTNRQLLLLTTLADLIQEVRSEVYRKAVESNWSNNGLASSRNESEISEYADAISLYLAFAVDRASDYGSAVCSWHNGPKMEAIRNTFGRQVIPMVWDFAEGNPFSESSGNFLKNIDWVVRCMEFFPCGKPGKAIQEDAQTQTTSKNKVVSTDPPYYNNINYSDLSDFFYVWLRRSLRLIFPDLFATVAVPKTEELVATPSRHGGRKLAEEFFLKGMSSAIKRIATNSHPAFPVTIYYAHKQSESETETGTYSTGWDTFLEAVIHSGFAITGTWPMRTELGNRMIGKDTNVLASSVILVCSPRQDVSAQTSRRQFIRELNAALPIALDAMTRESEGLHSPVAPVDLSQAIIGPGMAIFSKYSEVLEADGTPMTVRTALQLINRFLAEDDFDADTQFCLHWFEQYGWETGKFGEADTLARAKGTSVDGVKQAGVLHSASGSVRLLKWAEYPSDWDPQADQRLPIWEVLHQLIRVFNKDGETGAAAVFAAVQSKAEAARQLAYRLYTLCERKNWAEDARAYNEVVTSWSGIESAAAKGPTATQRTLFDN